MDPTIRRVIEIFHLLHMWQNDDESSLRKFFKRAFHFSLYISFSLILLFCTIQSDNPQVKPFLALSALAGVVVLVKAYFILWKKWKF